MLASSILSVALSGRRKHSNDLNSGGERSTQGGWPRPLFGWVSCVRFPSLLIVASPHGVVRFADAMVNLEVLFAELGDGQTCNYERAKWFGLFLFVLIYSLSVSLK